MDRNRENRSEGYAIFRLWNYQLGGYPVLKKWLGYRQADRRDGSRSRMMSAGGSRDHPARRDASCPRAALDALYQDGAEFAASISSTASGSAMAFCCSCGRAAMLPHLIDEPRELLA